MASISKERLREMEEEMDRFEAEIQVPGGPPRPSAGSFILGANTYDRVQAQLSTLRQESSRLQRQHQHNRDDDDDDDDNLFQDTDLRAGRGGRKRKFEEPDPAEGNEFHDIDERPGRPQGPLVAPPPPPPPSIPSGPVPPQGRLMVPGDIPLATVLAPPPPPPPEPEPEGNSQEGMPFKPPGQGEGGMHMPARPAFMPPQLRHRLPQPPPGHRPPFLRPPMRMGPPRPPPPPHIIMRGSGPNMGGPPMGPVMGPMGPQPGMGPPAPPSGLESNPVPYMNQPIEPANPVGQPIEQPQVVYAAAPVINVEIKKKKKKKVKSSDGKEAKKGQSQGGPTIGPVTPRLSSIASGTEEDRSVADMEIVPDSAMIGGIMAANVNPDSAVSAATIGMPMSKKEKKKKEKKFIRLAANTAWEDPTLSEWAQDDFRMFCGDLGNEVTDETLVRAFNKYPTFLKAKVVRDRRTNKTKGYGFVSFKDPLDFTRAMREMNGKYVGNRPIKLRKSNWKDRNIEVVRKKDREKKKLGLK